MEQSLTKEFGLLRSFLWPIRSSEFRKFIPMFAMLFLICFNYGILRPMKDTLIITAAGAKVLPYIKVWGILPIAILLTYFFTKLTHFFSQEKVFYIITTGFLVFFLVFAFVLYPLRDYLHPYQSANYLQTVLPRGLSGLVELYKHWTLSIFYIIAELWSSIVLSTLFWGLANEVTSLKQAKRFYGVFGIASNLAALAAGIAANMLGFVVQNSWNHMVSIFIITVTICGIIIMLIFRWQNKTVFTPNAYPNLHKTSASSFKKKVKPSLKESFKLLSKSKYLSYIAIMVVSYNLVINLMDVVWKDRLHMYCSSPQDLNYYMNNITAMIGLLSLIITFFIPRIIQRFGWTKTALITPAAMGLTGLAFFTFLIFGNTFTDLPLAATTPLAIAVFFGSLQHCLSKSVKYSLFDTTQNMAFIPLDHELKFKGKAPIDVVGARLGKSGGSLIYQGLLMFLGSIAACIPYIAFLFVGMMAFWTSSTRNLGKMFDLKVQKQAEEAELSTSDAAPQTT